MLLLMNELKAKLEDEIKQVESDVIKWRRHLHENPELSNQEFETKKYIEEKLKSFNGIELFHPTETSIIGVLKGEKCGETIAFKCDIDALPIYEKANVEFKSKNKGIMHACGHDAHVAMVLGAAKVLSNHKDKIQGTIKFIFQHSEEIMPGGEADIVNFGYVDDVKEFLAIHTNPFIKTGMLSTKPGVITASVDRFTIKIKGESGHTSQPQQSVNPILVGIEIVESIEGIIKRKVSPYIPEVISITQFDTNNEYHSIIPGNVTVGGCVRSLDEEVRHIVKDEIENIVKYTCEKYAIKYEINYTLKRNRTINNEELTVFCERLIKEHFNSGIYKRLDISYLIGDSFSAYANEKPGCFISLGVGNEEIDAKYHSHTDKFKIDEAALITGVKLFVLFAFKKLMKQ